MNDAKSIFARLWRGPDAYRKACEQWFVLGWQSAEIYDRDDTLGELARELNARVGAAIDAGRYAEAAALMPQVKAANAKGEGC